MAHVLSSVAVGAPCRRGRDGSSEAAVESSIPPTLMPSLYCPLLSSVPSPKLGRLQEGVLADADHGKTLICRRTVFVCCVPQQQALSELPCRTKTPRSAIPGPDLATDEPRRTRQVS